MLLKNMPKDICFYQCLSLLVDFLEKGLLILESEFFLEHLCQKDEPKRKKKTFSLKNGSVQEKKSIGQEHFIGCTKENLFFFSSEPKQMS